MLDHFFGNFEIGNHAISHRPDSTDIARRLAKHHLGFLANRQHLCTATHFGHGNNGWFIEDNALALHINKRICRSEIDADIGRKHIKNGSKHRISPRQDAGL